MVDIDGKKFSDTLPIMRMLGIKLGIYDCKDPVFAYHCDLIMDKCGDLIGLGAKSTQGDKAALK